MSAELRYEELFGQELQEAIARRPLAWVPLGILERHGEHLPWGLDGLKAHGVCMHLAQRLGGVVLPATHLAGVHGPWDKDPQVELKMKAQVGDFYLRPQTFTMLIEDTVDGLANIGFRLIVLYTGHYPTLQTDLLEDVARRRSVPGRLAVFSFAERDCFKQGDHAGKWETSLYLALGGRARLEAVRPEQMNRIGFWSEKSPPTTATREFGEQALTQMVTFFRDVIDRLMPPGKSR